MCVQGCVCSIKLPSPCLKRDGAERARVTNEAVEQKDKKAARTGLSQKGGRKIIKAKRENYPVKMMKTGQLFCEKGVNYYKGSELEAQTRLIGTVCL